MTTCTHPRLKLDAASGKYQCEAKCGAPLFDAKPVEIRAGQELCPEEIINAAMDDLHPDWVRRGLVKCDDKILGEWHGANEPSSFPGE